MLDWGLLAGTPLKVVAFTTNGLNLGVSALNYYMVTKAVQTYMALSCDADSHWSDLTRGFNGQLRTYELAGKGDWYTATYWEYNAPLGKRMNLDPVDQISVSNYATFRNNPIVFADPLGNTVVKKGETAKRDVENHTRERNVNSRGKDKGPNSDYNPDFAKWIKTWDDNKDITVTITTYCEDMKPYMKDVTENVGGSIAKTGANEYLIYYDPSHTMELGAAGVLEEAFHLHDAMEGKEMSFGANNECCANLDIYDEVRAKQWVANSPGTNATYRVQPDKKSDAEYNVTYSLRLDKKTTYYKGCSQFFTKWY